MTGEQIMYTVVAVIIGLVVIFVVSRRRGGKVTAKWGDKTIAAEGQSPAGRVEVGKEAVFESVDDVTATGIDGSSKAAADAVGGDVSVAERMKVKGGGKIVLTGVGQGDRTQQ